MKYLIVDDEQLARERLKELIRRGGGEHVLLEADNGIKALELAQSEHPDAILLDIRMPGMDGIETAGHLSRMEAPPAVIFTTAYDDHALAAFETNAVDYLLKPIRAERLLEALRKARVISRARSESLRRRDPGEHRRTHISVAHHGGIQLIAIRDIRYLHAEQKYVCVGWTGREVLLDESLRDLEAELAGRFLRVHRGTLVALEYLEALERAPDGTYQVRLSGASRLLPVSRRHLADVRGELRKKGLETGSDYS
ncbi:MAG: response regulator transcription factor [Gammaproteobacteria bacterium]|nr:response regulator transcription factor [Gammaproteobacteria bacterium]